MSRTKKPVRVNSPDVYESPTWSVEAIKQYLVDKTLMPGHGRPLRVLEPGAASGNIVRAVKSILPGSVSHIDAVELRPECYDDLNQCADGVYIGDFLTMGDRLPYDIIIGNPPYSLAREFIEKGMSLLREGGAMYYLLRINYVAPKCRKDLLRSNYPDMLVLSRRPSFTNGGSDGCEYAWYVWHKPFEHQEPRQHGNYVILDCPPPERQPRM